MYPINIIHYEHNYVWKVVEVPDFNIVKKVSMYFNNYVLIFYGLEMFDDQGCVLL